MAMSINEEGEEFIEDVLQESKKPENVLRHQQTERPHRLRRQVKNVTLPKKKLAAFSVINSIKKLNKKAH